MPRSLNKIMLIGNVGRDPEIRTTPSGTVVAKFTLATNRTWKDGAGNQQERTDWHHVTAWGKLGEIVEQWVHKGDRLYIEGRLEYSQTEGDDGTTRYWTDVIVQELLMLGSPQPGAPNGGSYSPGAEEEKKAKEGPEWDPEDDLPF